MAQTFISPSCIVDGALFPGSFVDRGLAGDPSYHFLGSIMRLPLLSGTFSRPETKAFCLPRPYRYSLFIVVWPLPPCLLASRYVCRSIYIHIVSAYVCLYQYRYSIRERQIAQVAFTSCFCQHKLL